MDERSLEFGRWLDYLQVDAIRTVPGCRCRQAFRASLVADGAQIAFSPNCCFGA